MQTVMEMKCSMIRGGNHLPNERGKMTILEHFFFLHEDMESKQK